MPSKERVVAAVIAVVALGVVGGALAWRRRAAEDASMRAAYVSWEEGGGAARAIEPNVAAGANGDVVVAWMRVPASQSRGGETAADAIGVRFARDPAPAPAAPAARAAPAAPTDFSPLVLVRSPDKRFAADPAIAALPDGAFVLTWLAFRADLAAHGEAYDMRVYAARAEPGARAFGEPALVTTDDADREYDRPWSTVTPRGRIVVGYRWFARAQGGIAVATSDDGGRTFRRRELFSRFNFGGGLVTTCSAREHVYVAWFDPAAGAILLRASHDGGDTFADDTQRTVSAPGETVALEAPSCVADRDEVVVSYGIGAGPIDTGASALLAHVALARSRDAGRTFDARASFSARDGALLHPRLQPLGGALSVVAYGARGELLLLRGGFGQNTDGAVLRGDLRVAPRRDDPAWAGDYLGYATRGERAYVAFVDAAGGAPQVAFFTR